MGLDAPDLDQLAAMAQEIAAQYGSGLPNNAPEADPEIEELGAAMMAPMLEMGEARADAAAAELGFMGGAMTAAARMLAPTVARGLATCDDEFAWRYISRLVVALQRARSWPVDGVAWQLYLDMGGQADSIAGGPEAATEPEGGPEILLAAEFAAVPYEDAPDFSQVDPEE